MLTCETNTSGILPSAQRHSPQTRRLLWLQWVVADGWEGHIMRKRREVEALHHRWGDTGAGARIWGGRQQTDSHGWCVWLCGLKWLKVCVYPGTLPAQWLDRHDLESEFSSAKAHNQHHAVLCRPQFCVSLDLLPLNLRPLMNAQHFPDSCGIQFWKATITANVKAEQNLCSNLIWCMKEDARRWRTSLPLPMNSAWNLWFTFETEFSFPWLKTVGQ